MYTTKEKTYIHVSTIPALIKEQILCTIIPYVGNGSMPKKLDLKNSYSFYTNKYAPVISPPGANRTLSYNNYVT